MSRKAQVKSQKSKVESPKSSRDAKFCVCTKSPKFKFIFMENQAEQKSSTANELKSPLSDDNKAFAVLSYLGLLSLIPLLLKKNNEYIQFHARQGFVLAIAEIAACFLNIIPFIGPIFWMILSFVFVIVSIVGIIKALEGEKWEIPVLSEYAKKIKI